MNFFEKVLLGLASLYHIQMKSPKTVYLTEQCQLMSHRNSVHSVRRGTKSQKRHVFGIEICYAFEVETCPYSIFILLSAE